MDHTTVSLTDDPLQHPHVFAAAFNTGDPDAVEQVYEVDGILATSPGTSAVGEQRRASNAALMALGIPIEVSLREAYVNDDLALLIVDWSIVGTAASGAAVDVRGTATDVARCGTDGMWRYAIDNPWGTAMRTDS